MSQKKANGKAGAEKTALHYRLTNEEWLKAVYDLKPAERDLLYHLRTLDPFGDRTLDLTVTSLAEALKVHKSTISRALKVLDRKGYIDLELKSVRVRLRNRIGAALLPSDNSVASAQQMLPSDNQIDRKATDDAQVQHSRSSDNGSSLKALPANASGSTQTLHTDQTKQISLKAERENSGSLLQENGEPVPEFREWLLQSMNKLPEKPNYPERWIEVNAVRTSMQRDFRNQQNAESKTDVPQSGYRGQEIFKATSDDVFYPSFGFCKLALQRGDEAIILERLQKLWRDGWHDVCTKICEQLPDCGVKVGKNGLEQVQLQDEAT